jgi:tetratricopeptide (TPR) repeat protein
MPEMSQTPGRRDDGLEGTDADPGSSRQPVPEGETAAVEPTLVFDTIPPPPQGNRPGWRTWAGLIWRDKMAIGAVRAPFELKSHADEVGEDEDHIPPDVPGFAILGECGRGGMGVVYLAEQEGLGRTVALKFLRPEHAGSASQRARLRAEAAALARLQHPNIVQVFSSGEHLGRAFIVQEYLPGGSLDSRFGRDPQQIRPAAELLRTLAAAVEYAHGQKIVHRDLKPSNVLLSAQGTPKISDFGLAKHIEEAGPSAGTQSGAILGSPSYMAPEQAMGRARDVGPRADIYALGAILYEMLTGRPPFLGTSMMETLVQVRSSDPIAPRQLRPGLPRDVETICLKCLAKEPTRRYDSAADLAADLGRFLEGRPILARPASLLERARKSVQRRPAVAGSLAAASLAAVALVVGSLAYESRLRSALSNAHTAADEARARKRASDERYRLAREAINLMLRRLDDRGLSQTPHVKELRRRQLEDALVFFRGVLGGVDALDPAARLDVADAYLQSGIAEGQLGRPGPARDNLSRAIELLRRIADADPGRADARFLLADAEKMLAQYVTAPGIEDGTGEVERLLEHARTLLEELARREPGAAKYRAELAAVRNNLGNYFWHAKRLDRAEAFYGQTIETCRDLLKAPGTPTPVDTRVLMAKSLHNLAVVVQQGDHKAAAEGHYAEGRRLMLEVLASDPRLDEATFQLGYLDLDLAIYLTYEPGGRERAEAIFNEAIGRVTPLLEREPDLAQARDLLYRLHGALAQSLEKGGLFAGAVTHRARAISLMSNPADRDHLRFIQALTIARAGDHLRAWDELVSLEPLLEGRSPEYTTHLAEVCAACLDAAGRDASPKADDRDALLRRFGEKGRALLARSLERTPEADRDAQRRAWREDVDLSPLLRVEGVQALLEKGLPSSGPPSGK